MNLNYSLKWIEKSRFDQNLEKKRTKNKWLPVRHSKMS